MKAEHFSERIFKAPWIGSLGVKAKTRTLVEALLAIVSHNTLHNHSTLLTWTIAYPHLYPNDGNPFESFPVKRDGTSYMGGAPGPFRVTYSIINGNRVYRSLVKHPNPHNNNLVACPWKKIVCTRLDSHRWREHVVHALDTLVLFYYPITI